MDLTSFLTDDLRQPKYRSNPNPLAGHCYVACEVLYHLYPGRYKPHFIRHEGEPHWFLREVVSGKVVDPTGNQFKTPVPYDKGIGKGFLTKLPSKRAQRVIEKVQNASRT